MIEEGTVLHGDGVLQVFIDDCGDMVKQLR